MGEYIVSPFSVKLHLGGTVADELVKTSDIRSFYHGYHKVNQFSTCKGFKLIALHLRTLNRRSQQTNSIKNCCSSALGNVGGAVISDWIPFTDQLILLASVFLTYIAGVVPAENSSYKKSQTTNPLVDVLPDDSSSLGSAIANDDEVSLQFAWDVVQCKLVDSLYAVKNGLNIAERIVGSEEIPVKQPISLCALAEGPRIRLLSSSFEQLNKEVATLSTYSSTESAGDFLFVFAEIIRNCCQPLCMTWLKEELHLILKKPDKDILSLAEKKLNGYDIVIQNIRKSGKEDLYAELIYALRFGSCRKGGYYNCSLFIQHGVAILEDLLIALADGIASMYLKLISIDGSLSGEMNNLGLNLCTLSTRALQRLRNEVALRQWLHQNMAAVASMYEDKFDLRTLKSQPIISSSNSSTAENFHWLKKLRFWDSMPLSSSSSLNSIVISNITLPVKRTKELRVLTGWRYYFSLFLELADIAMPLVRTVVSKVSEAISFFLVSLIGRSLGLIYSGIRNSLRLK